MRSPSIVLCVLCLILFSIPAQALKPGSNPTADLSTVTQNWDKKLSNDDRFTVLPDFTNQAVRDNETGLVWERSPSTSQASWYDAVRACWLRQVGGRMGWHLPTIEELSTLVDPSVPAPGPALPTGHPFQNIIASSY